MQPLRVFQISSLILCTAFSSAWGATIGYDVKIAFGPESCSGSVTGTSVSVTIASCGGFDVNGTPGFTASESGWTALAAETAGTTELTGNIRAFADFSPQAYIFGGSGAGFLRVEYTDSVQVGVVAYSTTQVSVHAGNISVAKSCGPENPFGCEISLKNSRWSGWIPFAFGEAVTLPEMSVSVDFSFTEGLANVPKASETVTAFTFVDSNMTPLAGVFASQTPEPSMLCLCGLGLAALAVLRSSPRSFLPSPLRRSH